MRNYSWEECIAPYLRFLNSAFVFERQKTGKKAHLLFVEGISDLKLYSSFFESEPYIQEGKIINLGFDSPKKIQTAFNSQFSKFMKEEPDKKDHVAFVISCIKKYETIEQMINSIDCFGFIDRDFGHDIATIKQLEKTTAHDSETNLIRCCMVSYFEKIKIDKQYALETFTGTVLFCLNQGILEKTSFDFEKHCLDNKVEFDAKNMIYLTHSYFKYESSRVCFTDFDFDEYIEEHREAFNDVFIDLYHKNKTEFAHFYKEIPVLLERWLMGKQLEEHEEKRLDKVLSFCNGHMLINQLVLIEKDLFNIKNNPYFDHNLFVDNLISFLKANGQKFYNLMPLKEYSNFRIKKQYLYK